MFNLVYVSTATRLFSSEELLKLLQHARTKNASVSVTGVLLYKRGAFMQALEGEETQVRKLYTVICGDERHHGVSTLLAVPVRDRNFPMWSMGFQKPAGQEIGDTSGYDPDPVFPTFEEKLPWNTSVAMRLLNGFKETD